MSFSTCICAVAWPSLTLILQFSCWLMPQPSAQTVAAEIWGRGATCPIWSFLEPSWLCSSLKIIFLLLSCPESKAFMDNLLKWHFKRQVDIKTIFHRGLYLGSQWVFFLPKAPCYFRRNVTCGGRSQGFCYVSRDGLVAVPLAVSGCCCCSKAKAPHPK